MWISMLLNGTPPKIVSILHNYYEGAVCSVRVYGIFTDSLSTGIRQGCILSPMIFNIIIDWIITRAGASSWQPT